MLQVTHESRLERSYSGSEKTRTEVVSFVQFCTEVSFCCWKFQVLKNWGDKGECKLDCLGKITQYLFTSLLPNIASHFPFYQLSVINLYALSAVIKYYSELINLRTEYRIFLKSRKNKEKLLFGIQNCKSIPVRSRCTSPLYEEAMATEQILLKKPDFSMYICKCHIFKIIKGFYNAFDTGTHYKNLL